MQRKRQSQRKKLPPRKFQTKAAMSLQSAAIVLSCPMLSWKSLLIWCCNNKFIPEHEEMSPLSEFFWHAALAFLAPGIQKCTLLSRAPSKIQSTMLQWDLIAKQHCWMQWMLKGVPLCCLNKVWWNQANATIVSGHCGKLLFLDKIVASAEGVKCWNAACTCTLTTFMECSTCVCTHVQQHNKTTVWFCKF